MTTCGCRIKNVRLKGGGEKIAVIPRAPGSDVLERLHGALAKAREVDAVEFAIVLRGRDGLVTTDFKLEDRWTFLGMIAALHAEVLND